MSFFCALATPLLSAPALAAPSAPPAKARPIAPAGSFLHRQAHSVPQLVQEVQADPVVRRRLARRLHLPESAVADYLDLNLTTGTLPRSGPYTVYFVAGSGLVYPTRMSLRAGTRVFVGRDGRPVLLAGSGDPLAPFAPVVVIHAVRNPPTRVKEIVVPTSGSDISVPATGPAPPPAAPGAAGLETNVTGGKAATKG